MACRLLSLFFFAPLLLRAFAPCMFHSNDRSDVIAASRPRAPRSRVRGRDAAGDRSRPRAPPGGPLAQRDPPPLRPTEPPPAPAPGAPPPPPADAPRPRSPPPD